MISSRRITIGAVTPAKLVSNIRGAITVRAAAAIYIGGEDLTVQNGFLLPAGDYISFDIASSDAMYALAQAGNVEVSVITNKGV